jgi:hypothetical protein
LTPEDTIVKALNDLTQALKDRRNKKGSEELDALRKLDDILNNIPTTSNNSKRVTFANTTNLPLATGINATIPTPRVVQEIQPPRITKAIPLSHTVGTSSTPRVGNDTRTPRVRLMRPSKVRATIDKPILTRAQLQKIAKDSLGRLRLRTYLRATRNTRARIPERIQLIHDADTNEYLNYRQLMRDPKHKDIWARSSANEFGRLTQGLKD